ncbi:hypothetical protein BDA96_05G153800 [Sorghum bicolor]|uniref:Uncharacterized protein n=2 Tax=Sorghum bicolor TaxID=4558 RepID=A0A921UGP0_SORBI|nr:hypothetical protein BDA96_07G102400 [Sorghum bicolor]KAG0530080.1 hypothetical protein BDA96_05G153800 [Sorghum bicolor]OQU83737.1 hypothetical protein SORBI_3005G166366 [Sorghum bicolor]
MNLQGIHMLTDFCVSRCEVLSPLQGVMVSSINMGSNEQREPCVASWDAWCNRM